MALDVEAIWAALADRITDKCDGFALITRDPSEQYGIEQYPVCEIAEGFEALDLDEDGLPPRYTLTGEIGIVVRNDKSAKGVTASKVNALVKAVREALERDDSQDSADSMRYWTDLGMPGLVLSLGRTQKMTLGKLAGEAWAKIEVEMRTL